MSGGIEEIYEDEKFQENEHLGKLITDNWDYVEGILERTGKDRVSINEIQFHYRTAMRHGWKHAMEYIKDGN